MALSKLLSAGFARIWANFRTSKILSEFSPWSRDNCLQQISAEFFGSLQQKKTSPNKLGSGREWGFGFQRTMPQQKKISYGVRTYAGDCPARKQLSRKGTWGSWWTLGWPWASSALATTKVNSNQGCIKQSIASRPCKVFHPLYWVLARPQLEVCVQCWAPQSRRDMDIVEESSQWPKVD